MSTNEIVESEVDDNTPGMQLHPVVESCLAGFGLAAHSISQIFRYKYEIKRLAVESNRIAEEMKTQRKMIAGQLEYELKKLDDRRRIIEKGLKLVSQELNQNHIERKEIITVFGELSRKVMDDSMSLEARKEIHFVISTCSGMLTHLGSTGSVNLSHVVENTERNLKAIPQNLKLLLETPSK